jgi:putative colanic acid biosynthesis UDP-glucose lipid carrier transferase
MRAKISLRENGNLVRSALHGFDCLFVISYLALLININAVPWSRYYLYVMALSVPISVAAFSYIQLYRSWRSEARHREFVLITKCWSAVVGILLFALFALGIEQQVSRRVMLAWFIGSPIILFGVHLAARTVLRRVRISGIDNKTCVIVGTGYLGKSVAKCIQNTPWAGIQIVGYFDDTAFGRHGDMAASPAIVGTIQDLQQYIIKKKVDYVYVALPMHRQEQIMNILSSCRTLGAELFVVPDIYSFYLANSEIRMLGDMIVLDFNPKLGIKSLFDILFAFTALILTSPLWLIIAALIKIEDGGPVFYAHERIRNTGRSFKCLKFRTMRIDASERLTEILERDVHARSEWLSSYKIKNDPRITKIGRFLRRSSLDELPQFLNVLRGEMSIVGARPIVKEELVKYYRKNGGLYCSAKPGITGPWQIGKRNDIAGYEERVDLDREYILNWSLWKDIKIISKTMVSMMTGRGAY